MDDAVLIQHVRKNADAFATLYRRYLTSVYRYLYRRTGNVQDAEDLTAQVFTTVLAGLTDNLYQERGYFVAWLFTIARRRTVDFYRQRPVEELADPPTMAPKVWEGIEKRQDLHHLAHLLSQLDEDRQELLRLRFSAGLSFAQIGQVDGRSEAAVKMAIYRTLDYLHAQWEVKND
ncbi:MAG: sigma-70 family RNA polymerase sigma factor [Brevefilum sp.]|nr:sigma-70 family RNA polymerase sigma factor [Brevefilum sp.]